MLDLQPLIDQVTENVYAMLVKFFHWPKNRTTRREAEAIAALAVGTFVRGDCECAERFRPPLGRRRDFATAKQRCEREHGVRVEAVAGHIAECRRISFPVALRAEYLGQPLTAELQASGVIRFQGRDYRELSGVTRAAKESVAGKWTDEDMKGFWQKQEGGVWKQVRANHLLPNSLPPGTQLRAKSLGRPLLEGKTAEIREDGVVCEDHAHHGLTAAAEAALESVLQDREHTNGWRFWQYQETNDKWLDLDRMRSQFWEDWGRAADPDVFWQTKTGSTRSLCATLQKAAANAAPNEIRRVISFPWIWYPDGRGADWGQVLWCATPIVTAFVYNKKHDHGTVNNEKWPEFIAELAASAGAAATPAAKSSLGHWLWQTLLKKLDPQTAEDLTRAASADKPDWAAVVTKDLKEKLTAALNAVAVEAELLQHVGDLLKEDATEPKPTSPKEALAACRRKWQNKVAAELLAGGPAIVGDLPRLTWLTRFLLAAAFPDYVPAPHPYRNGCGNADIGRECEGCSRAGKQPIPTILLPVRIFPKGQRFRWCAFCCEVCGTHWQAVDPTNADDRCPRCGGRRNSGVYEAWTERRTFGGDALDYLDGNGEESEDENGEESEHD